MFNEIAKGWSLNRYSAVIDGFCVMVQLSYFEGRNGISNGRITKLLIYPLSDKISCQKVIIYDRGWKDSVPQDDDIRTVIETTVHHFDGLDIDWNYEAKQYLSIVDCAIG